jgi:hypothetical protein
MISLRRARLLVVAALAVGFSACERATAPVASAGSATNHFIPLDLGTALVRHGPSLNGGARIIGSVQMMLPENVTMSGDARIWGDLLVPGTPSIKTTGHAEYDDIRNGSGNALPSNYKITLTGDARVDDIVRRTDPVAIEPVAAPPAPAGTRNITLNRASDNPGAWATVRNITLNERAGTIAIPGGTYGNLTANKSSTVRLGVEGSTLPTVYNFQKVTLSNDARVEIVGPVVVTVAGIAQINSDAFVGNLFRPDWLDFRVASGHFTLNKSAYFLGFARVPSGAVTLNDEASLVGGVEADELRMHGDSRLTLLARQVTPPPPPAPDISLSALERVDGPVRIAAPIFGEVVVGSTNTFEATVTSPLNTASTTANCSATVSGVPASDYVLTWITQSVSLAPGATGVCSFTLKPTAAADLSISVTATSASDPNTANDVATGTLSVKNPVDPALTSDLLVRSIAPLADIVAGTEVTYTAPIGMLSGTQASTEFNCVVTAKRLSDGTPVAVTLVNATGTAAVDTDGECSFRLGALSANGTQAESYEITVHADPTNANEISNANNTKVGTQRVTPKMVDVFVASVSRVSGTTLVPVDSVPANITAQYIASIGVAGASSDVSCVVNVKPRVNRLGATVITGLAGTVATPATPSEPAKCSFSINLVGNGDFDELYDIEVVAHPIGAIELGGQPNTVSVEQLAIVRVDITMDPVTMTVDGVSANPLTITRGKTGVYHAIIRNNSTRSAQMRCDVTVNGQPLDLPASLDAFTLAAGATQDCTFSITHSTLLVADILVVATALSPLDNNVDNNEQHVITTPVGDGHFVGVENATFLASETRRLDALGNVVLLASDPQNVEVTNLALFVTDSRTPIGYFKLVGSLSSNGVEFSRDSVGGPLDSTDPQLALNPGLPGIPSCINASRTNPLFKNNHTATLRICAEPVGQTSKQQITVSYASSKSGQVVNPVLFGNTVTVDVTLSWALAGAPVGVTDRAQARVEIDLFDLVQGSATKKLPTGCFRVFSGTDVVTGGSCS